ncbi:MAG: ABC transporter substrate-binding protein [Acidobacteriota bacterium]
MPMALYNLSPRPIRRESWRSACPPAALVALALVVLFSVPASPLVADDARAPSPAAGDGDLQRVLDRGALRMLCVPNQENPFIRTNLDAGPMKRVGGIDAFSGYDVEILSLVAQELGVKLQIVPALSDEGLPSYPHLIPALLAGEGDIIASSFSVTDERQRKISFSEPYWRSRVAVVVRKDRTDIRSVDDLAGLKASVLPGSSHSEFLDTLPGIRRVEVDLGIESYEAVSDGRADFLLDDYQGSQPGFMRFTDDLQIAFDLPLEDSYALGLRPGSDLLDRINGVLQELRDSGHLGAIFEE